MSVSLNLVQLITQERFAPEASNLIGTFLWIVLGEYMIPIDIQVSRSKDQGQRSCQSPKPCATDNSGTLCLRSFKLGR